MVPLVPHPSLHQPRDTRWTCLHPYSHHHCLRFQSCWAWRGTPRITLDFWPRSHTGASQWKRLATCRPKWRHKPGSRVRFKITNRHARRAALEATPDDKGEQEQGKQEETAPAAQKAVPTKVSPWSCRKTNVCKDVCQNRHHLTLSSITSQWKNNANESSDTTFASKYKPQDLFKSFMSSMNGVSMLRTWPNLFRMHEHTRS